MLQKINIDELAGKIAALPSKKSVYIHGTEDGRNPYGLVTTEAFDALVYLLCNPGKNHCRAASCSDSMRGTQELSAIKELLKSFWFDVGLTEFFIDPEEFGQQTDTVPVLATLVRIRESGLKAEVCTDTYVVEVPRSIEEHKLQEYVEARLRAAARNVLIGEHGDAAIKASCRDFNWGDWVLEFNGDRALGIHPLGNEPMSLRNAIAVDIGVNQDEVLLDEEADATLYIQRDNHDTSNGGAVVANMRMGFVYKQAMDTLPPIAPNDKLWLDFGNGVWHPVAHSEEARDGCEEQYHYFIYREDN